MSISSDPFERLRRMDESEAELALAVGQLAVEFGRLELDVAELVIASFGRTDLASRNGIAAVLGFRQKLDLVAAIAPARLKDPQQLAEVQRCVAKLGEFEESRNSLVHAFWAMSDNGEDISYEQTRYRANRKKGLIQSSKPADIAGIRELSASIRHFRRMFGQHDSLYAVADILHKASKNVGEC